MSHILIAGDVHGAVISFYKKVLKLQDELKEPLAAILQLGDFQVYSKESHIDKAVIKHGGAGDFPEWLDNKQCVPIPTYAILGNHDDAELFYQYAGKEILPSLHLLSQGEVSSIDVGGQVIRIGALGGNFSPKYFQMKPAELPPGKLKHYTNAHIRALLEKAPFDILLTHEAPVGFVEKNGADLGRPEINGLIERTKPRFAFFGHHHRRVEGMIGDTVVVGLANARDDGGLCVIENMKNGQQTHR